MDIGFTEKQELLRASARRFLENECPSAFVRQGMAEPAAVTDVFWQKLAEQGWFGILYPEEAGGSRLGLVDMPPPHFSARSTVAGRHWCACSTRRPWRFAPKCAAAPNRCST
jgi:alkylation response protein AidB-like acyl-CoA dehydrogenase